MCQGKLLSTHVSQKNWIWIKKKKVTFGPKKWHFLLEKWRKNDRKVREYRTAEHGTRALGGFYKSQRKSVTEVLFRHNKIYFYLLTPETHFYSMSNKMGTNFHTKKILFTWALIANFWPMLVYHIQLHQRFRWEL